MTHEEQIRTVARILPQMIGTLHGYVTDKIGDDAHAILLIVACANEAQFTTNQDAATVRRILREIAPAFAERPGEEPVEGAPVPPELVGNTIVLEHLLDIYAQAIQLRATPEQIATARANVIGQFRDRAHLQAGA
jgi:hypothetical protein